MRGGGASSTATAERSSRAPCGPSSPCRSRRRAVCRQRLARRFALATAGRAQGVHACTRALGRARCPQPVMNARHVDSCSRMSETRRERPYVSLSLSLSLSLSTSRSSVFVSPSPSSSCVTGMLMSHTHTDTITCCSIIDKPKRTTRAAEPRAGCVPLCAVWTQNCGSS